MTGQTPITFPDLHRIAYSMGLRLKRHDGGLPAWYDHKSRTISTRRGMSATLYRSSLAHELGHAHYGHMPPQDPVEYRYQERLADEYAARLLITPQEYRRAETEVGHWPEAIADELEVTAHLVEVWQRLWQARRITGAA